MECLRCTKPGTGTVDAPRAFSLKLKGITQGDEGGLYPALHDAELEMRHVHQKLIVLITTHVDDLKMLGEADEVDRLIRMLEKHVGKCTQTITDFTNIGIHHQFLEKGVTMDQFAYIKTLKPIQHPP